MPEPHVRVLAVEDNALQLRLLEALLAESQRPRFDLISAGTLAEALRILQRGGIDIVLLDLVLPDSAELDTFARLHAHAGDIPIIILSALDDVTVAAKAVDSGAQDYLIK